MESTIDEDLFHDRHDTSWSYRASCLFGDFPADRTESEGSTKDDEGESWTLSSEDSDLTHRRSEEELVLLESDSRSTFAGYDVISSTTSMGTAARKSSELLRQGDLKKQLVSAPTIEELQEDTHNFGEPFEEYMCRLYTMADNGLLGLDSQLTEVDSVEDDQLSSDFEMDYLRGSENAENAFGWAAIALQPDPWAEARHPTPQIMKQDEMKFSDFKTAEISLRLAAHGISNLTQLLDETKWGCTKLQLSGWVVKTLERLSKYKFLQYIDLMDNEIVDVRPLWQIEHLIVLDVSRNNVTDEGFGKPEGMAFLTYLNVSYNSLTRIPDLSASWALKHLNLSNNAISKIENLKQLSFLEYLNLSANNITVVEELYNEFLVELKINNNKISQWCPEVSSRLWKLMVLDLSYNKMTSLSTLKLLHRLNNLDLSFNCISNMLEVDNLRTFTALEELNIVGNDLMMQIDGIRQLLIYCNAHIQILNNVEIHSEERAKAIRLFSLENFYDLMVKDAVMFYRKHCFVPSNGQPIDKAPGYHPAIILIISFLCSNIAEIVSECKMMNPRKIRLVGQVSTKSKTSAGMEDIIGICSSKLKKVSHKKFYKLEDEGYFVYRYGSMGFKFGIPLAELMYPDQVLLLSVTLPGALDIIGQGWKPSLVLVAPEDTEALSNRVAHWYQTKVFRVDEHTRRVNEMIQLQSLKTAFNVGKTWMRWKKHLPSNTQNLYRWRSRRELHKQEESPLHRTRKLERRKLRRMPLNTEFFRFSSMTSECTREEDRFVQNILSLRENYIHEHMMNPGLFRKYIPSDDIHAAAQELNNLVEEAYRRLEVNKKESADMLPIIDQELFDEMVMPDVEEYVKEILNVSVPPYIIH